MPLAASQAGQLMAMRYSMPAMLVSLLFASKSSTQSVSGAVYLNSFLSGMANAISYGPRGGIVLGRNISIREMSYQKRYRGGRVGHLWCDIEGNGMFQRLLQLDGNIADPCWVGERIYFLSDYEGVSNVYSCTPFGENVRRHTDHQDFPMRVICPAMGSGCLSSYHAGADLFLFLIPAKWRSTSSLMLALPSYTHPA